MNKDVLLAKYAPSGNINMARAKNKKRRVAAKSDMPRVKTATMMKGPGARSSKPSKSRSDFDTDAANLRSRVTGAKKKNINHSPILLSQPTFVAPTVQAEKAEKEAAKARQERLNMLLGEEKSGSQNSDTMLKSVKQQRSPRNRFFGLDVDGEIVADERARVSLSQGILSSVVVRDDDDEL